MHHEGLVAGRERRAVKLQTCPYCAELVVAYAMVLALVTWLIIGAGLPASLLSVFTIPSVLAAAFLRRRVFLSMQVLQLAGAIWVMWVGAADAAIMPAIGGLRSSGALWSATVGVESAVGAGSLLWFTLPQRGTLLQRGTLYEGG